MEFDISKGTLHTMILKKRHWRSALWTVFRLMKCEGLVDDENLAALNLTLRPPSLSTTLSPELTSQLDSYMSGEDFVEVWQLEQDWIAEKKPRPSRMGEMYCSKIGSQYLNIGERQLQSGCFWYWVST